jgi:hypothetical protein
MKTSLRGNLLYWAGLLCGVAGCALFATTPGAPAVIGAGLAVAGFSLTCAVVLPFVALALLDGLGKFDGDRTVAVGEETCHCGAAVPIPAEGNSNLCSQCGCRLSHNASGVGFSAPGPHSRDSYPA